MGHKQNELRNAAGLILELRITVAVQNLKISFYMQILVPPLLLASAPPHFVCSGDGTAATLNCVPRCFEEEMALQTRAPPPPPPPPPPP